MKRVTNHRLPVLEYACFKYLKLIFLITKHDNFQRRSSNAPNEVLNEGEKDGVKHMHNALEESSKDKIKGNICFKYFKAGTSIIVVLIVLFVFLLTQVVIGLTDYFISLL